MITTDPKIIDTLAASIPSVQLSPALQRFFGNETVTGEQFVALVRRFGIILTVRYDEAVQTLLLKDS